MRAPEGTCDGEAGAPTGGGKASTVAVEFEENQLRFRNPKTQISQTLRLEERDEFGFQDEGVTGGPGCPFIPWGRAQFGKIQIEYEIATR